MSQQTQSSVTTESQHALISRCLSKIIKECGRKQKILKDECTRVLESLSKFFHSDKLLQPYKDPLQPEPNMSSERITEQWDTFANQLFSVLRMACESKVATIMEAALDCLEKLLAHGYIRGTTPFFEKPGEKLIAVVINCIANCFDAPDDNVQLQILKAFLTAVTTPTCDIHETNLMNSIRTCYNVYLVTKNQNNRNAAKGTLTQMLHAVFQRFDALKGTKHAVPRDTNETNETKQNTSIGSDSSQTSVDVSIQQFSTKKLSTPESDRNVVTEAPTTQVSTKKSESETIAENIVNEIIDEVTKRSSSSSTETTQSTQSQSPPSTSSLRELPNGEVIYNDAFLVFRALCKLSMKEIPNANTDDQSIDVLSKILSLELLFNIVESATSFIKHNERFIDDAIRKYLCFAVLTNGVSPIPKVFRLSMSLFLTLLFNFKEHLKTEIEVFFEKIILRTLESSNSTQFQKRMVIQVLHKICKKPQLLCDIFLNYDCDPGGKNIFESVVKLLSKIAQSEPWDSDPQKKETSTKALALEVIVAVLRSLVDWSAELYEPPEDASSTSESESSDREEVETGEMAANTLLRTHTPDKFEQQKQLKLLLDRGKEIFRLHPKKGVQFFIQAGLCGSTPAEVAIFFLQTPGLDRTKIGEYFGERDPFCLSVLHSYVDNMNFQGMEIDSALRKFLYDFRLPGEGQKIDRILEKFAERYYAQNPNTYFATADVAYMVSFGLVLLNTDLHHPENKNKMTLAKWKESLQSLSEEMKNFDDAYLGVLYERIAKEPIRFVDDDDRFGLLNRNINTMNDPKHRQMILAQETQQLIKKTQEQIKEKSKVKRQFFKASSITYVKPMFQVSWHPILISFGLILDETEDLKIVSLCLEGFKLAIRIAGMFYMDLELDAFVTTLAKFTHLESLSEIKQKNIECIHTLIEIAYTEGNNLRNSWKSVLNRISQLERLHILGSGGKIDDSMGSGHTSDTTPPTSPLKNVPGSVKRGVNVSNFEVVNAPTIASQIKTSAIDRIFTNSAKLNNNAILDFVVSLCAVSKDELSLANPRIFSLQKLVEIAHFNMNNRIRIVWLKIWKVLAEHFTFAGCHDNKRVAMYAIDSLRQLSVKFLEKEELANYNFQKEFLKPFEVVSKTDSRDIRELVIQCLEQMIKSRAAAIKSGWKNILTVITSAAFDRDDVVVKLCWEVVEHIRDNCFEMLIEQGVFREYVQALAAYATSARQIEIASKAIQSLHSCAVFLVSGKLQFPRIWKHKDETELETEKASTQTSCERNSNSQSVIEDTLNESAPTNEVESNYQKQKQKKGQAKVKFINPLNETKALHTLWFALLSGMTGALHHKQLDVKNTAIEMLFKTLNLCGQHFDHELWEMVFLHVIIPAFGSAFPPSNRQLTQEEEEWWAGTGLKTLHNTVLIFSSFFDKVSFLLDSLLELFVNCILQGNETLATSGATCFELLLSTCSEKFTQDQWNHVSQVIASTLRKHIPFDIDKIVVETTIGSSNLNENESSSVNQPSGSSSVSTVGTEKRSIDKGKDSAQLKISTVSGVSTEKKGEETVAPSLTKKTSDIHLNIDKLRQSQHEQSDARMTQAQSITLSKQSEAMKNLSGKIRVQNLLITIIVKERVLDNEMCLEKLTAEHIVILLDALFDSYEFTLRCLTSASLREALDNALLDLLIKQETIAISSYFETLFKFYGNTSPNNPRRQLAEAKLLNDLKKVFGKYLEFLKEKKTLGEKFSVKAQRVLNAQVVIVKNLLISLTNWNDELFSKHLGTLFELFVELIVSDSDELREILRTLLTRIGRLKLF